MTCVIIEDQAPATRILKKYIQDFGELNLLNSFSSAIEAEVFLASNDVDLLFLDIHLPQLSGIDFLKKLVDPPSVILTTAFTDFALQGYEFNVVDYLVKPFSYERFVQAVNKVPKHLLTEGDELVFIKSGHEYHKLKLKEILYIHSDMDYTDLHLSNKKIVTSETLNYWEKKLSGQLVRVHKSYLVNLSAIVKITGNKIFISNDFILPLGRAYKEPFFERYVV